MRRINLNTLLVLLLLVGITPILAVAIWAVYRTSETSREASITKLGDTVVPLRNVVEAELQRATSIASRLALIAYGDGTLRDEGPLNRVYLEPNGELASFGAGTTIELVRSGLDAIPRSGFSQKGIPYETIRRSYASGTAQISNLYSNLPNGPPKIAIVVPGPMTMEGRWFVALLLPPERLISLLKGEGEHNSSILIAVTDGAGRLVARSVDAAEFVGKQVPDWKKLTDTNSDRGVFEGRSFNGGVIVFAFDTLRLTPGWKIVVGEPYNAFMLRAYQPIVDLVIGALIALLVAVIACAFLSSYILRSLNAVTRFADAVASGQRGNVELGESRVAEFHALGRNMELSQTRILERTNELITSERRYRTLANVGALVFWTQTASGRAKSVTGWKELTGGKERDALGTGWMAHVHPDDLAGLSGDWLNSVRSVGHFDVEFRVKAIDGSWKWVRSRGGLVDGLDGKQEWVGVLEDVDARRKAQDRLAHMAIHDPLTGLGNRTKLMTALTTLEREKSPADILFLDLDRFKQINDTLGHSVGDALLRSASTRLSQELSPADTIARLGGDEFAIVTRVGTGEVLAAELIERLAEPFQVLGYSITIGTSIGIAKLAGGSAEAALREADLALNAAKAEGRGTFRCYKEHMYAKATARSRVEAELRLAVDRRELEVYYQPLVNPVSRKLSGFEALLRWNHPQRGVLPPSEFIDLAEEVGLIVPIGSQVLIDACKQAAVWPGALKIAVNVSAAQLQSGRLIESVKHALEVSGLEPSRLELEISENAVMENLQSAMAALLQLKLIGCSIAMDDFGSGGSSLAYLGSFPFSRIKIDKSFVLNLGGGPENGAIVKAVTSICSTLGITSTGEGVETEEQLEFLKAAHCSEVQGYLFGKATRAVDLPKLIASLDIDVAHSGSRKRRAAPSARTARAVAAE